MTLDKSFNVVEPAVKRAYPRHALAPAWCTMWLEKAGVEEPTEADIQNALRAYSKRIDEAMYPGGFMPEERIPRD